MADSGKKAVLPPQNIDAEESVIGAMLLSPVAIDVVSTILTAGDFYRHAHGRIFDIIIGLHVDGEPADAITVAAAIETSKNLDDDVIATIRARLRELAVLVPATSNVGHYARIVREMATRRGLTVVGEQVAQLGWTGEEPGPDLVERASALVYELARGSSSDFVTLADTVNPAYERIQELYESGATITGVSTGLRVLDEWTSGLQPGNLVIVAGRPSMGKTALGLSILANVIRRDEPAALFTFEMSRSEVTQRLLSMEAFVDLKEVRTGRLDIEGWRAVSEIAGRLSSAPLFIADTALTTLLDLRAKARRLKTRRPDLALIVVDYLQLMGAVDGGRDGRVQEVSAISRGLKVLAGDLGIPILAVSQLSRAPEGRHDRRPMLSDLRESGAIEQDADVVALLYRDEYYHPEDADELGTAGICEVNIAKQRNGPVGTVQLSFIKRNARFSDLARPGAGDPR